MLPDSIKNFIDAFSELPSLGPRQAARLAFYIIRRGKNFAGDLARAIDNLKYINTCSRCFFTYQNSSNQNAGLCYICVNSQRQHDIVAIVEKETDLISLEKTKRYNGRYLVLGEIAKDGILTSEQKLRLQNLKNDLSKQFGQAQEIIIALNPTAAGDFEAGLLVQELKPAALKITRLGRGLPTGGEIEFADEDTLGGALDNRK